MTKHFRDWELVARELGDYDPSYFGSDGVFMERCKSTEYVGQWVDSLKACELIVELRNKIKELTDEH